jgi:PIN domain nuclease of toxin-antitoxin system
MLNLDTHVLLYALADELTPAEARALSSETWSISAVVLWEVAKLAQFRRIEVDLDDAELTRALSRIHTWPVSLEVCRAIRELDFRADPADELIAATSLVHRVPLLTRDRILLRSRRVPLARLRRRRRR